MGGGGQIIHLAPNMDVATANITPDKETGIGSWTDDDIRNALTKGVRPDGGHLSPPMPSQFFANMTPADVDSVVAYLRTIPAISNKVERTDFQKAQFP
jgi:hypothetical protein